MKKCYGRTDRRNDGRNDGQVSINIPQLFQSGRIIEFWNKKDKHNQGLIESV